MNVADYLVSFLCAIGVRHVFGYPGSPLVPLLSALERQTDVQWVLMRHENAAALAASAQAKLTDRLSVCVATSGPGALNFVCGVVDAHLDRVPMLALTGLVGRRFSGMIEIDGSFWAISLSFLKFWTVAMSRSWIDCLISPRQRARLKP
jgi:thiamine pyrophosphate-dependent acetolactate synthase large subunit-like protein